MKTVFDHIDYVKSKPHHIRKKVAFGAAASCTALIALIWLATSLTTGAFALQQSSFADATGGGTVVVDVGTPQGLAGASAAFAGTSAATPHIQIVDTSSTTKSKPAERTMIPF